ncbi:hypothetical protein [Hoyosella altamirensis]|uniref:Uncharacterized protein n=1 Tax=Hoyosella altamirensis TaxID=616997 RepID=A0A839RWI9_9ACTN|nr:hypothetical protein [Hoyosella altamirensis]MBB3040111.1 hypothetical protein [Hoyosella altamirensis]
MATFAAIILNVHDNDAVEMFKFDADTSAFTKNQIDLIATIIAEREHGPQWRVRMIIPILGATLEVLSDHLG